VVTRRDVLALAAALPFTIPRMDSSDWVPNTTAGLDEPTELGFSDLMALPSHGPYIRRAWLDLPEGEQLPVVRGMFWCALYDLHTTGSTLKIGANFGDGWNNHEVAINPELNEYGMVENEAITGVIRLLIREHAGVETRFIEV